MKNNLSLVRRLFLNYKKNDFCFENNYRSEYLKENEKIVKERFPPIKRYKIKIKKFNLNPIHKMENSSIVGNQ